MRTLSMMAVLGLVIPALAFVPFEDEKDLSEIKCPVSGKAVDPDQTVAYKGAEVYFCCANCPKAFEKDTAKYAAKANAQLVATEQAEQTACPFTGKEINEEKTTEVAGATVAFCCDNCLAKAEAADEAEQLEMIFADKPFEKAFEVVEADDSK